MVSGHFSQIFTIAYKPIQHPDNFKCNYTVINVMTNQGRKPFLLSPIIDFEYNNTSVLYFYIVLYIL